MDAESKIVPKYYRISRQIIERIRSGELRPGMRVPSENELIRRHGISNTTARKALHEIEAEGWCTRVKGKGTFVRERSVQRSATRILGGRLYSVDPGARRPPHRQRLLGHHQRTSLRHDEPGVQNPPAAFRR